jgi:hypothetical protein
MKCRYYLAYAQTTINPQDPGFATLAAARKEMRTDVAAEKMACRRRYKRAFVHRCGDCVEITLGPERDSAMWQRIAIVKF